MGGMRLTTDAIRQAYQAHARVYAGQRAWDVGYHIGCWARAHQAFENRARAEFDWLYDQLRGQWQAFRRRGGDPWTADQTFDQLAGLDKRYRVLKLSQLDARADLEGCWMVIKAMSGIKPTKSPSVVAISKFLHFWNPRLFVIVDDAVMWQRVLSRTWLKQPIAAERARLMGALADPDCPKNEMSCDLLWYLAVLTWAGALLRQNPVITPLFAEYVRSVEHDHPIDFPLDEYQSAAVEWLLLGLAEIPPPGVELS
ncbi:MAG: hypothetical protein DYG94_06465 [Leptolyngbya sp. PLA3]|nr:MAG: hypothetical protein EDM82_05745 [Cyanobacteria bacterium CYA]MCE7968373.1 hypothetical protein [Leptolyngbya sp. PL-A3]